MLNKKKLFKSGVINAVNHMAKRHWRTIWSILSYSSRQRFNIYESCKERNSTMAFFSLKKCQWCLRKRYCIFHSSDNIVSTNNVQSTILIQMIGPNKREWCSSHCCCCQRHTIVHTNKTSPQYETIPIHITRYWYVCHKKGTSFLQQAILQISRRMS